MTVFDTSEAAEIVAQRIEDRRFPIVGLSGWPQATAEADLASTSSELPVVPTSGRALPKIMSMAFQATAITVALFAP